MKKMLMVATVPSMIGQFNMSNLSLLMELGYEPHIACNFKDRSIWMDDETEKFRTEMKNLSIPCHQIDFSRSPWNIGQGINSYRQMKCLQNEIKFDFIHCHTPVASVVSRIIAHKSNVRLIYTAHGFHFFKGGPLKNWLLYYPIEKVLSRWTDILIVINREDYALAKNRFHAKRVVYIPGVGFDTKKFSTTNVDVKGKRKEFGVPYNAFLLLSVGELLERKNHRVVIDALYKLNIPDIYYVLVGEGELRREYEALIEQYRLQRNVKLLGYRVDIDELCAISDCFVHPSVREGLGIAPLEAMASGLPLISSYINGIKDYTENNVSGCCIFNPTSVGEMTDAIQKMYTNADFRRKCGANNRKTAKKFDITNTNNIMKRLYQNLK